MSVEFKRLRASLENNAQGEPSIYMALCLMETLVYDIEQESGSGTLDQCPAGDDTLPTKLIWLCRKIGAVYRTKGPDFVRNRENLEKAMVKLRETEEELAALADAERQRGEASARLAETEEKLARARALQADAEAMRRHTEELEAQLTRLKEVDSSADQRRANELEQEILRLGREQEAFRAAEIAPRQERKQAAAARLAALDREKAELEKQLAELDAQYGARVLTLAEQKRALEDRRLALEEKQGEADAVAARVREEEEKEEQLTGKIKMDTAQLAKLQSATARLEAEDLPRLQQMKQAEDSRARELGRRKQELTEELKQQTEANGVKQRECEELQKDLDTDRTTYEALTSDYNIKNQELQELTKQLQDLQGKTDTEKHAAFKRQQEEKLAALKKLGEETRRVEAENKELDGKIVESQEQLGRLRTSRDMKSQTEADTAARLRELKAVVTPEFQNQARLLSERLALLERTRSALFDTCAEIRSAMGISPAEKDEALPETLGSTLTGLNRYTASLGEALKKCAESVKQNLREET